MMFARRAAVARIGPTIVFVASLAACQSTPPQPHPGLAFVEASCGGCHSVERHGVSPNPGAPPFAAIANQEGLTEATLGSWLLDAHNYPEEMEFELDQPEVSGLADYILTLRDPGYRPGI